jgi:hypothetical protein
MRAFAFTTHVARPPEVVWAIMTDLSRAPRWRPLVQRMVTTDGGPIAAGSSIEITMEVMGELHRRRSLTTGFDPPRRWVLRSESNDIQGDWEFGVAPENGGSRVSFSCELTSPRFFRRLMLPLIARTERRIRGEQLGNLKRLVEGQAG